MYFLLPDYNLYGRTIFKNKIQNRHHYCNQCFIAVQRSAMQNVQCFQMKKNFIVALHSLTVQWSQISDSILNDRPFWPEDILCMYTLNIESMWTTDRIWCCILCGVCEQNNVHFWKSIFEFQIHSITCMNIKPKDYYATDYIPCQLLHICISFSGWILKLNYTYIDFIYKLGTCSTLKHTNHLCSVLKKWCFRLFSTVQVKQQFFVVVVV